MWMRIVLLGAAAASLTGPSDVKAAPVNCPMVKCVAPNCPTSQQETPKNANGCSLCPVCKEGGTICPMDVQSCPDGSYVSRQPPSCAFKPCPTKPCVCGESCKMTSGSMGVCQVGGECAQNIQAPQCPCKCGESCKMKSGSMGVCQVGGECGQNIMKPDCPSKVCTMEAKLCPDGSSVGRVPPNCEFAPCPPGGVACTADAKVCPDGSSVGRVPPKCEFAPCPTSCVCGESCKMKSGSTGVCQVNGECAVNIVKPQCPTTGVCTMEAKLCPDGSSVGRVPPKCEFAPCPKCVCGSSCKAKNLKAGICQANGKCKPGKAKAKCGKS